MEHMISIESKWIDRYDRYSLKDMFILFHILIPRARWIDRYFCRLQVHF